jgi:hypothetical protein
VDTTGQIRNAYKNVVGKTLGKYPLERIRIYEDRL